MRKLAIILLLLLHFATAKADYGYIRLPELVGMADYGAIGTIVAIDQSYFYLKVEDYVLNKLTFDTLKILKFENWECAKRYAKYELGQKELVFFRKSNYVIADYDLLGYGAGSEFELPIRKDSIFYNCSYGRLRSYKLDDFITALKDYDKVRQKIRETSKVISKEEQQSFADKSPLHKLFIEYQQGNTEKAAETPPQYYMSNIGEGYLYQEYENRIYIHGINMDSVFMAVEDASVWKEGQYFVVKPKHGWTRRWLNIYANGETNETHVLFNQIFDIVELPEPRIYFGNYYQDTISTYSYRRLIPTVAHYLDYMHQDEYLKYELLSYTYQIKSHGHIRSYKVKSAWGNHELLEAVRKVKQGDVVTIKDIFVMYPNNTVRQIKAQSFSIGKIGF